MPAAARAQSAAPLPAHPLVAYFESWWDIPATTAGPTRLANLPGYLDVVILGFARPDLTYAHPLETGATGLQFPYAGRVLREAIERLRARAPRLRVLVAVGGSAYGNWGHFDERAVARLVADLGLDGVDIDFEPAAPDCYPRPPDGVSCRSDAALRDYTARLRAVLPRPAILSAALWSVGAYGRGAWTDAPPRSAYRGMAVNLLAGPAGGALDLVSIMAYEAGPHFEPAQAFAAYRAIWPGPLALGINVALKAREDARYTTARAEALAAQVARDPAGGMMLYGLLGRPVGRVGPDNPDGALLAQALCRGLGKARCEDAVR